MLGDYVVNEAGTNQSLSGRNPVRYDENDSYASGKYGVHTWIDEDGIPRMTNLHPNFQYTPGSFSGGKLINGRVYYPEGVDVDKAHAGRSQAFFDMSYGASGTGDSVMSRLYGSDYDNEINRLTNLKPGEYSWAELPAAEREARYGSGNTGAAAQTLEPGYEDYKAAYSQGSGGGSGGEDFLLSGGGIYAPAYDYNTSASGGSGNLGFPASSGGINVPAPDYSGMMDQLAAIMNSTGGLSVVPGTSDGSQNAGLSGNAALPAASGTSGTPGSSPAQISQSDMDYLAAIDEAKNASAEALRQQIASGVNTIYGQRDTLGNDFEKAAQQAYIAKMKGQKNLPEQLAAQGLTGGASESSNLALEANYGNGLNDLTNTYNQGLSQLEQQAAQLEANGNIAIAQNDSQFAQIKANAAQQAQQQARQLQAQKDLQAQQIQAQKDLQTQQIQSQHALAEYNSKISMLQQAATLAAQLGMTEYQAQINAQLKQYEVASQQALAQFEAARQAELQAQQLAAQAQQQAQQIQAQWDITKYQADIEAQEQASQREWQRQQAELQRKWDLQDAQTKLDMEYDDWLKKFNVQNQADIAAEQRKIASKAAGYNSGYSADTDGDLFSDLEDGSSAGTTQQGLYNEIVNSKEMTDAEKKRRLQANGFKWSV